MCRTTKAGLCFGIIAGLAAVSAFGQTFSYSEDFNSYATGTKPAGWTTANNHPLPAIPALDPAVLTADPGSWGTVCDPTGYTVIPGCSTLGPTGIQNYGVPWSGGGRFNLIHPALSPGDTNGWAGAAWYDGSDTTKHTGTYPLPLETNRLRVAFDMIVRTGDTRCTIPADGGVFAVVPVTNLSADINAIGGAGGGEGWLGLGGFAIEFDIYDNGSPQDPAGGDAANHIGLDVNLLGMTSATTNVNLVGESSIPRFVTVGDNNQPLHITVFYNDARLSGGGVGVVQVYLKVDPATYNDAFGGTLAGAQSYGMTGGTDDPDNPGTTLGMKVLEVCVGAWPTSSGIFGFTGSIGGCNSVYQVDNVSAVAAPISGTACVPTGLPTWDPGVEVILDPTGAETGATAADLTSPGWDVATYPLFADNLDGFKASLATDAINNLIFGSSTGQPDLNFNDSDCAGNVGNDRVFPGLPNQAQDYFGAVAKGWIYFPPDDGSSPYPRSYALSLNSDDGFEVLFGTGKTNQIAKQFTAGRGCGSSADTASTFKLVVPEAGVYPIQILYFEMGGGAGLEFARRIVTDSLLLVPPLQLVGTGVGPFSDQPLVFGLYKGKAAPDLISTYAPLTVPTVTLDPGQKVNGTGTGTSGFNVKVVTPNPGFDGPNIEDAGDGVVLRWLDSLNSIAPGSVTDVINFREPGQGTGPIAGGYDFPGLSVARDYFALRADGFVTFPTAGIYALGVDSDDSAYVRIGKQTIYSTGCCPNKRFLLNVTAPGTYPVRCEILEWTGDARLDFYDAEAGYGWGSVNSAASKIKVNVAATSGTYIWPTNGWDIPADRKVAEVGQGGTLGWNAILAQMPGVPLQAQWNHDNPSQGGQGLATAEIENDVAGVGVGLATQGFDHPDVVNYVDIGDGGGNFGDDRTTANFLKADSTQMFLAGGNDAFAISATGYIEFPAAGDYALGTNGDDGRVLWVAGKIVSIHPYDTGPADSTPGIVRINAPGIYDIRMDFFENGGGAEVEVFQYLPSGGDRVLINDPAATVKVYQSLAVAPATTLYQNPVRLPLSAKVAPIDRGGEPGARIRLVNATFLEGNGDGGIGHDQLHNLQQATELLDSVTGDGPVSLSQFGTLVADVTSPTIDFGDGTFPGAVSADDFAMRATGVLALTKGGHILEVGSDDGFTMRMAGLVVGQSGALKGNNWVHFYVNAPEDGLYPFTLDWLERGGGNSVQLYEVEAALNPTPSLTGEAVNTGNAIKMYVSANPCATPFADINGDGDVDQRDFGDFQICFTGNAGTPGLPAQCKCFDQDRNGFIDSVDYANFAKCVSGPDIPWTPAVAPDCVP